MITTDATTQPMRTYQGCRVASRPSAPNTRPSLATHPSHPSHRVTRSGGPGEGRGGEPGTVSVGSLYVGDLTDGLGEQEYDAFYVRFVLTHLRDPEGGVEDTSCE